MNELALFAGIGGGILGGMLSGWRTVCAVERDRFCRSVLLARQRDGCLPRFPIWDDIETFNGRPWRGVVDIVSGGFPCQDVSSAGKRAGLAGRSSGLWYEMLRVVDEVRPRFVFAENSPHLRTSGLGAVLQGLTSLGYDARWCVLGARHVGAPHRRDRMWVLANANLGGERAFSIDAEMARAQKVFTSSAIMGDAPNSDDGRQRQLELRRRRGAEREEKAEFRRGDWWRDFSIARVDDGLANRVDRTKATGNAQVPAVAALAWKILSGIDNG